MKVVDMFGAGLPVAAVDFAALPELVRDGENGVVFRDAASLARALVRLFDGFPDAPASQRLAALRGGVAKTFASRWEDNWAAVAAPLFA
jgi:beta-1,4-mannosyltransferase